MSNRCALVTSRLTADCQFPGLNNRYRGTSVPPEHSVSGHSAKPLISKGHTLITGLDPIGQALDGASSSGNPSRVEFMSSPHIPTRHLILTVSNPF